MKKKTLLLLFFALAVAGLMAQDPGINYQAVARDANGQILSNTNINVRFQYREGSPSGTLLYQETFSPVTNDFGLFWLVMGEGNAESGLFEDIDWSAGDIYLISEINGAKIDTSVFRSVPYSKLATDMKLSDLIDVGSTAPASNQALIWNGSGWEPGNAVVITGSGATTVSGSYPNFVISSTDEVDDADADPANELQTLSLSGNQLTLSLGGGSVTLPGSPWSVNGSSVYYTGGNVGIGTSAPASALTVGDGKFQVDGSTGAVTFVDPAAGILFPAVAGSSSPMITMFGSGTNNDTRMVLAHSPAFSGWGLQYEDARDVFLFRKSVFLGARVPVMHVGLQSGHVGIGTDTPSASLHILRNNNGLYMPHLLLESDAQSDSVSLEFRNNGNNWRMTARGFSLKFNFDGPLVSEPDPVSIDPSGLYIKRLSSFHNVFLAPYGLALLKQTGAYFKYKSSSISPVYPITAYAIYAEAGVSENASYDPVCVGISGISQDANSRANYGVRALASNSTYRNYGITGSASGAGSSVNYGVYATASGGSVAYAGYFNGDVYSAGSYLPSDRKLKEDLAAYSGGLAVVMNLMPERYRYRADMREKMNLPEGLQYGFVAQDVKEILPQLVKRTYQPLDNFEENAAEGGKEEEGIYFDAVNYTGMIPFIVSAIQEQQRIIEKKDAKISELENELESLRKRLDRLEAGQAKVKKP